MSTAGPDYPAMISAAEAEAEALKAEEAECRSEVQRLKAELERVHARMFDIANPWSGRGLLGEAVTKEARLRQEQEHSLLPLAVWRVPPRDDGDYRIVKITPKRLYVGAVGGRPLTYSRETGARDGNYDDGRRLDVPACESAWAARGGGQ